MNPPKIDPGTACSDSSTSHLLQNGKVCLNSTPQAKGNRDRILQRSSQAAWFTLRSFLCWEAQGY